MIAETLVTIVGVLLVLLILRKVVTEWIQERPMVAAASGAAFVLTLILTFVGFITFQTLYPYEVPLKVGQTTNKAAYQIEDGETVFKYSRDFTVSQVFNADVNRRIDCVVGVRTHVFDLPRITKEYAVGEYTKVDRYALFPYPLPIGTKCVMHTSISWSPSFSMASRISELPVMEYIVDSPPRVGELVPKPAEPQVGTERAANL